MDLEQFVVSCCQWYWRYPWNDDVFTAMDGISGIVTWLIISVYLSDRRFIELLRVMPAERQAHLVSGHVTYLDLNKLLSLAVSGNGGIRGVLMFLLVFVT
jgi:hypothetical protein